MAKTKQIYKTILKTADKMHTIVKKQYIKNLPKSRSERQIIQRKKQHKGGFKLNPANCMSISLASSDLICDEAFEKMLELYTGDQQLETKFPT